MTVHHQTWAWIIRETTQGVLWRIPNPGKYIVDGYPGIRLDGWFIHTECHMTAISSFSQLNALDSIHRLFRECEACVEGSFYDKHHHHQYHQQRTFYYQKCLNNNSDLLISQSHLDQGLLVVQPRFYHVSLHQNVLVRQQQQQARLSLPTTVDVLQQYGKHLL